MDGYLLIDKPKEWTSFDVVNKVRHIVQKSGLSNSNKKRFPVGHTGTLDPLATGLLVLILGDYTKRAPTLTKLDKTYEVTMQLGVTSSTGDEEGEKSSVSDQVPTDEAVQRSLKHFEGEIEQTPPIFSAVKVNGQRAYKLARAGKEVKLEPRKVAIYSIDETEYQYPQVKFTVRVSSGTYVRTLVEDIGKHLETGAYMSDLRRTKVGDFDISDAKNMQSIDAEIIAASLRTV